MAQNHNHTALLCIATHKSKQHLDLVDFHDANLCCHVESNLTLKHV